MDAIAAYLGKDRTEVRAVNFIQPDEFPYDHGLIFQDGRELEYDSGDYPASLEKLKALVGWDEFPAFRAEMAARGPAGRHRPRLLRRGHRRRPLRGRPRAHRDLRQGQGRDRPDHPGPGPRDGVRADRRRRARRAVRGRRGGHRRHPPDAVRRGHVRLARGGDERLGDPPGRQAGQGEGAADRRRRAGGDRGRPRDRRRRGVGARAHRTRRSTSAPSRCCPTRCATPSTRRPRRPPSSPSATRASRRWPRTTSRAWRARTSTRPSASTFASGMHAVIVETDPETAEITILKYAVVHDCGHLINPMIVEGQIHGGVAQGVGGALYERMAYDESGQLLNASFMDFLMPYVTEVPDAHRHRPPRDAVAAQPARHQGRRRGGRDPVGRGLRRRDRGRRGLPDHGDADLAVRAVRAAPRARDAHPTRRPHEDHRRGHPARPRRAGLGRAARPAPCWSRTIPGCERLEATGENTYAMTVTAGVAAIRAPTPARARSPTSKPHESLVMKLQGAGAPGTIGATVRRALRRQRRRHHHGRLRRRRGRRRHGRRRRPADADLGLASGWPASSSATSTTAIAGGPAAAAAPVATRAGVGRRRRTRAGRRRCSPPRQAVGPAGARLRSTTSSRASPSAPGSVLARRRRSAGRSSGRPAMTDLDASTRPPARWPPPSGRRDLRARAARPAPGPDRRAQPRAQRDRLPRRGARPRRAPPPPTRRWPSGDERRPAARAAVRVQGHPRVAGWRTTYGSPLFADHVARRTTTCSSSGSAAPARCSIGKTNVPEFAAGSHTFNTVFGTTLNPVDPITLRGRLERGSGVRARVRDGAAGRRLRHGRLAAQPGVVLRRRRAAALARPGAGVAARQPVGDAPRSAARWPATSATSRCCCRCIAGPDPRAPLGAGRPRHVVRPAAHAGAARRAAGRACSVDLGGAFEVDHEVAAVVRATAARPRRRRARRSAAAHPDLAAGRRHLPHPARLALPGQARAAARRAPRRRSSRRWPTTSAPASR